MIDWKANLERALGESLEASATLSRGSAAQALKLKSRSGKIYFAKVSPDPSAIFREEAIGLRAVSEVGALRCPKVIYVDDHALVAEWFEREPAQKNFWTNFGRGLADLHRKTHDHFGFASSNHIGATEQLNPLKSIAEINWTEFFIEHRLKPMLHHSQLTTDALLQATFSKATAQIRKELDRVRERPCLVHGDLWNGNYICAPEQTPVLIDPAPYFGHREVDLAMTELFGGFEPDFYKVYKKEFPTAPGYDKRKLIYNLYHLLNHWILFGVSYRGETMQTFNKICAF